MSLQVWLPLNGNTSNQGLNGLSMTGSPNSWGDGKIGKCATFNGNVMYSITTELNYTDNFSYCLWINQNYSGAAAEYAFTVGRADTGGYGYGINILSASAIRLWFGSRTIDIPCPANEWHHIAFTVSGTIIKVYKDGALISPYTTQTLPTYSDGNGLGLGCFHYIDGDIYPYHGSLNDFRIYDHCLSDREVKEISKGLVCHYLMNQPEQSPNLSTLPSCIPDFPNGAGTSVFSSSTDGISRRLTCTTTGDGGRYNTCFSNSVRLENTTYTWSIDIRASKNMLVSIGLEGGGDAYVNVTTDWQRISKTAVLLTDTYSAFVIYPHTNAAVGDWVEVKHLKVEKNNFATSWSPCSSDYPKWSDNIEYDCSGYRYDGTISELLSYASGSPRYDGCYYFNSASKRITLPAIPMSGFSNSFSISWWGKAPSYSSLMYWGFSDGNRLNYYYGLYCNTGDGFDNPYYRPNTTTTISTPSVNAWHHFVMVGDGSSNKLYMDGELYGVAKAYRGITGSTIVINGWDSSTDYKTNGYISDFRIYSTVLSASDIKELYNTFASVDKNGNIYAYEFKEE